MLEKQLKFERATGKGLCTRSVVALYIVVMFVVSAAFSLDDLTAAR